MQIVFDVMRARSAGSRSAGFISIPRQFHDSPIERANSGKVSQEIRDSKSIRSIVDNLPWKIAVVESAESGFTHVTLFSPTRAIRTIPRQPKQPFQSDIIISYNTYL
jgi:hypothetical protein